MAISEAYTNTLKAKAVAEFVSENKRSPTESELRVLLWETYQKYSVVDQVGLSGFDINKPALYPQQRTKTRTGIRFTMI